MNSIAPKNIAMTTLQSLPSATSWPDIFDALVSVWASTTPAAVLARAIEVFEEETKAVGWLTKPCRSLGDKIPLVLVEEEKGQQAVLDELTRIEHGVFS